jgi:hypothetical protein
MVEDEIRKEEMKKVKDLLSIHNYGKKHIEKKENYFTMRPVHPSLVNTGPQAIKSKQIRDALTKSDL